MNKKTVIYILGCVLVFVSAFMLLPWFVSLIYSEETGKYFCIQQLQALSLEGS